LSNSDEHSPLAAKIGNAHATARSEETLVTRSIERLAERELAKFPEPSPEFALLNVFRHRNYRLFISGQFVSLMGTWMQTVAQAWLVYSLTHSLFLLGLTTFCSQVTIFFIAPFGGMVADRVDRRKMLLLTQSLAMLQAALLAMFTLSAPGDRQGMAGGSPAQ
jgi:hypothetical protein